MQAKRSRQRALFAVLALGALAAVGWIDWRPARPARAPHAEAAFATHGTLIAGAAKVELSPGGEVVRAGYPPPRPVASGFRSPLFARALVLESAGKAIGIVSFELLEVPAALAAELDSRGRALGLQGVVATATHVHSSFGGYDDSLLAQVAATGRRDSSAVQTVLEAGERSLKLALDARRPVEVKLGQSLLPGLTRNRAEPDDVLDPQVVALRLVPTGQPDAPPLAQLFVFAAHPTLVPRGSAQLDGGFPGVAMARLEAEGGVALFLQGAVGDISAVPPESDAPPSEVMGVRLAGAVERAAASAHPRRELELGWAHAGLLLPRADAPSSVPSMFRRPVSNLLQTVAAETASVEVVRVGSLVMAFVPGEPTSAVERELHERISPLVPGSRLVVVGLAQGYLGYVESAERMRQGRGESRRTLWEADLSVRIAEAIAVAVDASKAAR